MISTTKVIIAARKHVGFDAAARANLAIAIDHRDNGNLDLARKAALESLSRSVGKFSPEYKRCTD
jgi:hypothetical protein